MCGVDGKEDPVVWFLEDNKRHKALVRRYGTKRNRMKVLLYFPDTVTQMWVHEYHKGISLTETGRHTPSQTQTQTQPSTRKRKAQAPPAPASTTTNTTKRHTGKRRNEIRKIVEEQEETAQKVAAQQARSAELQKTRINTVIVEEKKTKSNIVDLTTSAEESIHSLLAMRNQGT